MQSSEPKDLPIFEEIESSIIATSYKDNISTADADADVEDSKKSKENIDADIIWQNLTKINGKYVLKT